jgi:type IV pilus assembly protein PilZ
MHLASDKLARQMRIMMRKTIPIPAFHMSQTHGGNQDLPLDASSSVVSASTATMKLSLYCRDKKHLLQSYMPFLRHGGLFVPSGEVYVLGAPVVLSVRLPKEQQDIEVTGVVAWITPNNAFNKRIQGIGIHFNASQQADFLRLKIETLLGPAVKSLKSTFTI